MKKLIKLQMASFGVCSNLHLLRVTEKSENQNEDLCEKKRVN